MKITMSTSRRSASHWAPLILRAIVGYGFMAHGYAKLARGPQAFAVTLEALGVPIPRISGRRNRFVGRSRAVTSGRLNRF